jgi:D-alanyl-D-alanine dipeptidase
MKPYRTIPIRECYEELVPIPPDSLVLTEPPPYLALGAPYGGGSPWMLRQGVLDALLKLQVELEGLRPGWKIKLFDAYRPNSVQAFMVDREFRLRATASRINRHSMTSTDRERLADNVFRLWAIPDDNPATPPPHSTGAAIDCTLRTADGHDAEMGSPIDENSNRSLPDHFRAATDATGKMAHTNRILLRSLMHMGGFHQHHSEWWHFSKGDQMWAYAEQTQKLNFAAIARYGRADLL